MKKHLAIMHKAAIEAILSGQKIVESRFSQHKIPPFGQVGRGDLVYMKPPGGEIVGQFRVKKVYSYEGLTEEDLGLIFSQYGPAISWRKPGELEKYRLEKRGCSFGTLIFIAGSERFITSPIKVKKSDLRGWMVLG